MPSAPDLPSAPRRFPFRSPVGSPAAPGEAALSPLLPLLLEPLTSTDRTPLAADGLLDTGASVSVLPYRLGLAPGAVWPEHTAAPLRLGGNLAGFEAHPLLTARVADFAPVRLAFAWTREERVPLILGQVNFFLEFDGCFFRSRSTFEVRPEHA